MTSRRSSFGVGFSESSNSLKAGASAVSEALTQAGLSSEEVQLCFLFCTSRHDPEDFFQGSKKWSFRNNQVFLEVLPTAPVPMTTWDTMDIKPWWVYGEIQTSPSIY
ncbi:hypothetical protein [Algoriphagus boritolerans]|uniref:hypothetical protein n=1 Tax=Algoriphagus boritolerans TaxID=308111 RepID=UPI000AFF3669